MTDRPARDARVGAQYGTGQRLNPGELEEIEAAARRGAMLAPNETLALVNTITALTRRIAIRFNETAEARHAVVKLSDRINELETTLKDRERLTLVRNLETAHRTMDEMERELAETRKTAEKLEQRNQRLVDEMARHNREKDQRIASEQREVRRLNKINRDLDQQITDVAASAARERELTKETRQEAARLANRVEELVRERSDMLNKGAAGTVGQKLHQRVEELVTQLKDARVQITDLRGQVNARYTRDQVAQLQTSEAELVSTPLKARIEELEKELRGRDVTIRRLQERIEDLTERDREAVARKDAAEHRAARHMRRLEETEAQLHQADLALEQAHRQQAVDADHARQLQAQVDSLNVAINDWAKAGKKIADAVFGQTVDRALEEIGDRPSQYPHLAQAVQNVRAAMPAYRDQDPPPGSVHA